MKILFRTLLISFALIPGISCKAQLVQIPADAKKLQVNEKRFLAKPLYILIFFCGLGIGVKAQHQDKKELSSFFYYIIDSIITENNPGNDTILIKSKTNESLYKYCGGPDLKKFISLTFNESDKTEILNGLRTA